MEDKKQKLIEKKGYTLITLFTITPIGIYLLFRYGHYTKTIRVVLSFIFGLSFASTLSLGYSNLEIFLTVIIIVHFILMLLINYREKHQ